MGFAAGAMLRPLALLAWLDCAAAMPSSCREHWEDPQMRAHLLWQSLRCVGQAGPQINAQRCMGIVCSWTVIKAQTPECVTAASCAEACDKAEGCSDFSRFCGAITTQGTTFLLATQDRPLANSTALMGSSATTSANRSSQANISAHIETLVLHDAAVKHTPGFPKNLGSGLVFCSAFLVILGSFKALTAFWARTSRPEVAEPLLG
ncbi:unnamed protein product [Symbiodinium sp. CCMP2592]|nr:unnamed protein product [Symbiodinium sp. CCMP2592]